MEQVQRDVTDIRSPLVVEKVPRPPHLKALTSIRFFAAFYVAVYHMVRPFSLWGAFEGFFAAGYAAVSFFFLLSGFILAYTHATEYEIGKGDAKRFWVARFARIYPVYFVVMLLAAYIARSQFSNPVHILAYIADLFMVQTWSARMAPYFNVPAWSLSVEAFFYFVFPFLILRQRPSNARKGILQLVLLWIVGLIPAMIVMHLYPDAKGVWHEYGPAMGGYWIYRVRRLPILLLPIFMAGISLGWIHRLRPAGKTAALWMTIVGGTGSLVLLALGDHLPFVMLHNGLLIPFYGLLILGLTQNHIISKALSIAPLVLLGEASYALYLTHFILNDWLSYEWGMASTIHALWLKLLIVLPISIALHLWVERPGRRWILKKWNERRKATA